MNQDKIAAEIERVADVMRRRANMGTWDGRESARDRAYMRLCSGVHEPTRTRLIFTRDIGHHSSGWLKNPDYERCYHLSLSPLPGRIILMTPQIAELDPATSYAWVKAFYGEHVSKVWAESPKSEIGRQAHVWHWRLFCDAAWNPILPRGEVYSTELTEIGWRSASQVFEEDGIEILSTVDPS